ncbi:MAG: ABC transporter ATP-binding protein, partial [Lewinella sp.]|nr:ABC transporter ATP-binding protein [Lewinella sp.]
MEQEKLSFKDQLSALRHLPRFFALIWQTHKGLAIANILLRIIKSAIPLATLYIGKEIVDEVIRLYEKSGESHTFLWELVALEFALAILSEVLSRGINLVESLLGDLFANQTSVDLIKHAADLDLYQFENADFYDKLERARRQTTGRTVLMSQVLSQFQDGIAVFFLGAGLVAFNPWLILLLIIAIIPSFLGESYFNQRSYSLTRSWTPERRELDYLRFIGASDQFAKEVKSFGLSGFIATRFK